MGRKPKGDLRDRICIAFISVVLIPLLLCTIFGGVIISHRLGVLGKQFGIENPSIGNIYNNTLMVSPIMEDQLEELQRVLMEEPDQAENSEYLEKLNNELHQEGAFLVVRKGDSIYFNGSRNRKDSEMIDQLPKFQKVLTEDAESEHFIRVTEVAYFKQVDFFFSDGSEGSIFLLTKVDQVKPSIRNAMIQLVLVMVIMLIITCICMAIWIYRGVMDPISELQKAAQNIRDGNLNVEIKGSSVKEMNDLCRDFEEMRIRLKESSEERMAMDGKSRELVSNISHDLKTPVTAIKGYVEGLLDGVATTPEKQEKYLRTIYNKTVEVARLIDELTLYSKIDTNRIPYNFAKLNVKDYFEDCREELRMELEQQGFRLNYYDYLHEDAWIVADPEQLRRVINNIIGNSVKYMDKAEGVINIRIRDVGDFIQCEFEDNGKGIEYKDLAHIFDRFYRSDTARSSKGGSGIGLSIVKKIIEDHEGKVWATSKAGVGTVIYFVLRKYQEVPR